MIVAAALVITVAIFVLARSIDGVAKAIRDQDRIDPNAPRVHTAHGGFYHAKEPDDG